MGGDGERHHDYDNFARTRRDYKLVAICERCGYLVYRKAKLARNRTYTHLKCRGKMRSIDMLDRDRTQAIEDFLDRKAATDERVLAVAKDPTVSHFVEEMGARKVMNELDANKIDRPVFARMYFRKKMKQDGAVPLSARPRHWAFS